MSAFMGVLKKLKGCFKRSVLQTFRVYLGAGACDGPGRLRSFGLSILEFLQGNLTLSDLSTASNINCIVSIFLTKYPIL